jgi:hypothetical protein
MSLMGSSVDWTQLRVSWLENISTETSKLKVKRKKKKEMGEK